MIIITMANGQWHRPILLSHSRPTLSWKLLLNKANEGVGQIASTEQFLIENEIAKLVALTSVVVLSKYCQFECQEN